MFQGPVVLLVFPLNLPCTPWNSPELDIVDKLTEFLESSIGQAELCSRSFGILQGIIDVKQTLRQTSWGEFQGVQGRARTKARRTREKSNS